MSNRWFKIRFLFWHFQSSPDKWFKLSFNRHNWQNHRLRCFLLPIGIYTLFGVRL